MIAIIDYGMGNIHSVNKALETMGAQTVVTNKAETLASADKLVLPGVGAFGDAMDELEKQGLVKVIQDQVKKKKTLLGICLGMQLLFEKSEESPKVKGLGLLKGAVKRFPGKDGLKVPHMGWNQLKSAMSGCPLLNDIPEGAFVYFCHSYYAQPNDKPVSAAVTDYGVDFPAIVWQNNIFGVQFHPEKSQQVGLQMVRNFVEM